MHGQNVYLFFLHSGSESEEQHVAGNLQAVVKAFPTFSISGKAFAESTQILELRTIETTFKTNFLEDYTNLSSKMTSENCINTCINLVL